MIMLKGIDKIIMYTTLKLVLQVTKPLKRETVHNLCLCESDARNFIFLQCSNNLI